MTTIRILKRIIGATASTAHRINVIMPFLYESRQHKRTHRESLDCAMALEELVSMGVVQHHHHLMHMTRAYRTRSVIRP